MAYAVSRSIILSCMGISQLTHQSKLLYNDNDIAWLFYASPSRPADLPYGINKTTTQADTSSPVASDFMMPFVKQYGLPDLDQVLST